MKALLPIPLILALTFPACSSADRVSDNVERMAEGVADRAERTLQNDEPYLTKEFTLSGNGNLRVETSGGNITVKGADGNLVRVEMFVNKSSWGNRRSSKDVEEALQNYNIDVSQSGNTVNAIAENKSRNWSGNNNISISFVVRVPHAMASQLRTSGGNVTVENVDGRQELRTSGGNITGQGIGGDMEAHTSGGDINIQAYKGNLDARTSGGNIRLENATGDLKVSTSGGNIRLNAITGGVEARTSGGNITAEVDKPGKFLTLATSGGDVTVTLPEGIGMDVNLRGGRVNTSFKNFDGDLRSDRVTGKVNGGGMAVDLRTSGGKINLVQR